MNDFEKRWIGLFTVGHSGGSLRVYPDHPLDFFLDYSLAGRREVIIEAKGVNEEISDLPSFENIEIVCAEFAAGTRIGLTLVDDQLAKSFSIMCFDLAERSNKGESPSAAFGIVIESLRNWAELLKRRRNGGLTRNETMGLWGELTTLEKILLENDHDQAVIVRGWRGPNNDQRDIGFNGIRIEVKTQLSTQAISLKISSLEQLDERGDRLRVALNRISPSVDGASLVEVVARIGQLLARNNLVLSEFDRKMELSGFVADCQVSHEKFGLDERIFYHVSDDFPRLIPANVPLGIKRAEYVINGLAITKFQIEWNDLMDRHND